MRYEQVLQHYIPLGKQNVLLVWPDFYSPYPPLGLLKLASYHRSVGDRVALIRPPYTAPWKPDLILITSLFTYSWRSVARAAAFYHYLYPAAPIFLGGIYASLMEKHAKENVPGLTYVHAGLVEEAEELMPAYDLLTEWMPQWDGSIIFASRGCVRRCPFCAVPKIEKFFSPRETISPFVDPSHSRIIFWDNNFLASPYAHNILEELASLRNSRGKPYAVDFNQGLDARLLTPEYALAIATLKVPFIRLSYDSPAERESVRRAIALLKEAGFHPRKIVVYVLYNYGTPESFLSRIQDLMEWDVAVYPMRYQPLDATEKDRYVDTKSGWTQELLEMVADARRTLGTSGAWAPAPAVREKFCRARTLYEAMALRPKRKGREEKVRQPLPQLL